MRVIAAKESLLGRYRSITESRQRPLHYFPSWGFVCPSNIYPLRTYSYKTHQAKASDPNPIFLSNDIPSPRLTQSRIPIQPDAFLQFSHHVNFKPHFAKIHLCAKCDVQHTTIPVSEAPALDLTTMPILAPWLDAKTVKG